MRLNKQPKRKKRLIINPTLDQPIDAAAATRFTSAYGERPFTDVVVLIAAYNEAGAIGAVLDEMPATVCDLLVTTLVVTDGCEDGTAAVVREHESGEDSDGRRKAMVCEVPENRGQGAALRLGYRLAREGGARYIVTTDADGQYHLDEMPALVAPLIAGKADFVTGSRRLGYYEVTDTVRRHGVHVFARIVTVLTGQQITDTSFGMRAMRAEITGEITLKQQQYQSSELLIGVISHGFTVLEVPGTFRRRASGASKKGNNLVYGARYGRVVLGTWLREGRKGRAKRRVGHPHPVAGEHD